MNAFGVFVPSRLLKSVSLEYNDYGLKVKHIETLNGHFGKSALTEDGKEHGLVVDKDKLKEEWPVVKEIMSANNRVLSKMVGPTCFGMRHSSSE